MSPRTLLPLLAVLTSAACDRSGSATPPEPAPSTPAAPAPTPHSVQATRAEAGAEQAGATLKMTAHALPGASAPAAIDYAMFERARSRAWVPFASGGKGAVAVYDPVSSTFARIEGFTSMEKETNGKTRTLGPSAVSEGDGQIYIGNRATSEVCAIDAKTTKLGACVKLPNATDGVAYVASAHEVWVTTPHNQALAVLDATKPAALATKTTIATPGDPEGFAVDETLGIFYTNLEDKNLTLAIDVKTHKITSTWKPGCGSDGPRGLVIDSKRRMLVVACTDHLQVLDAAHDGALKGRLDTGAGVDNIDMDKSLIVAAAGKAAKVTLARLDDSGELTLVADGPTSEGARNGVLDAKGNIYVPDAKQARLLVLTR